jgi:hypothetical protein
MPFKLDSFMRNIFHPRESNQIDFTNKRLVKIKYLTKYEKECNFFEKHFWSLSFVQFLLTSFLCKAIIIDQFASLEYSISFSRFKS